MILQNMKNLLLHLPGLERLELVDLQLDGHDGEYTRLTLKRLSLVLSLLFMIFDIYSWQSTLQVQQNTQMGTSQEVNRS